MLLLFHVFEEGGSVSDTTDLIPHRKRAGIAVYRVLAHTTEGLDGG